MNSHPSTRTPFAPPDQEKCQGQSKVTQITTTFTFGHLWDQPKRDGENPTSMYPPK